MKLNVLWGNCRMSAKNEIHEECIKKNAKYFSTAIFLNKCWLFGWTVLLNLIGENALSYT